MLTVRYCCCGFSLRTGTLAILSVFAALYTVGGLHNIYAGFNVGFMFILLDFLTFLVPAAVSILGIFGVIQGRPTYVMPFLFFLVFTILTMAPLANVVAHGGKQFIIHIPEGMEPLRNMFAGLFVGLQVFILSILGVYLYCFFVVLSYYKQVHG